MPIPSCFAEKPTAQHQTVFSDKQIAAAANRKAIRISWNTLGDKPKNPVTPVPNILLPLRHKAISLIIENGKLQQECKLRLRWQAKLALLRLSCLFPLPLLYTS
jgi:hypothetical protein